MNRAERIELLNRVAGTLNHDVNGHFVPGETDRLDLIKKILENTGYSMSEIGLCHLYSKKPLKEIEGTVTVISSHVDTHMHITKPFSRVKNEKKLEGTYDNSITNAANLTLMLEDRLPDNVVVAFTGDEEYGSRGADGLGRYLKENGIKAHIIVTDVTHLGYDEKNDFSFENSCHAQKWTKDELKRFKNSDYKWELRGNNEDDETVSYSGNGLECFSFCIPIKGKMHSNDGVKARIATYDRYIEALCMAACG